MNRLKILILLDYYLPGFNGGGPLRSIKNLVDQLGDDFDFRIITSDRDLGSDLPYDEIQADTWINFEGVNVYYISPGNLSISGWSKIISNTEHDILYLNSFFQPRFTFLPLMARRLGKLPSKPTIVAPRGELLEGCLKIKSLKKTIYLFLAKSIGLYKNLNWQASSKFEVVSFKDVMGSVASRIQIATNLPPIPQEINIENPRISGTPLKVCFISRLTQEKNLEYALQVLKKVEVPVVFDIYGPKQDEEYWKMCEALILEQKEPVSVSYCGELEHKFINETFLKYDLFFFPSKGENFGHVIIEAMLMGTPVLLSDTTPWRSLREKGVGWDLSLDDPLSFVKAINDAYNATPEEYKVFRESVRQYAIEVSLDKEAIKASKLLFLDAS
ncbi:glycosyltransferase family 4 protein [Pedobacter frigoris]|uniref:Glycosyltransferase family 4 protein n=1 Tax=Pedobacter frigoris TaxID=2571272 RepID=A0A4U1CK05_9SPHI|nr:glycosyltransferase family 4 protein [Pedobacter frigoris]TKC05276.1 glycosyltransferase family 4 protein [Pedobacter frigoris]